LRADELRTLADMGASWRTAALLVGGELVGLIAIGTIFALGLAWVALAVAGRVSAFL